MKKRAGDKYHQRPRAKVEFQRIVNSVGERAKGEFMGVRSGPGFPMRVTTRQRQVGLQGKTNVDN